MKLVIRTLVVLFGLSVASIVGYLIYMRTKKVQYPELVFTRYGKDDDVASVQHLVNSAIRGVNGWMWLATTFIILYYFINFWSMAFMLLNIVIVAYQYEGNQWLVMFLVVGSLFLSLFDFLIDTKAKSVHFHKQWFDTSAITKEYIVKFSMADSFKDLCAMVIEFNEKIYEKNTHVNFL